MLLFLDVDDKASLGQELFEKALNLAKTVAYPYQKNVALGNKILALLNEGASTFQHEKCIVELANVYFFAKYGIAANVSLATVLYRRAAKMFGNGEAQRMLAVMHEFGCGLDRNEAKALTFYKFAAFAGDYYAQCILGYKYTNGIGVPKNNELAVSYFKKAAETEVLRYSSGEFKNYLSLKLTQESDLKFSIHKKKDAIQFYIYNAENGDENSQFLVGQIFFHGTDGFPQDYHQSFRFMSMAAKAGNRLAKGYTALMYAKGLGVAKNSEKAKLLSLESIEGSGNGPAYHTLGLLAEEAFSLHSDASQMEAAIDFFVKGSEKDFAESHYKLGFLLMRYSPSVSIPKAIQYLTLASRHGHLLSIYELGKLNYSSGDTDSFQMAIHFFSTVAYKGLIAELLFHGYNSFIAGNVDYAFGAFILTAATGLESGLVNAAYMLDLNKMYDLALTLWNRAAHQGFSYGYVKCADYFFYGRGTPINYSAAIRYYSSGSQAGSAEAAYSLGYMYEFGLGIDKDFLLAIAYYSKSKILDKNGVFAIKISLFRIRVKKIIIRLRRLFKIRFYLLPICLSLLLTFIGAKVLLQNGPHVNAPRDFEWFRNFIRKYLPVKPTIADMDPNTDQLVTEVVDSLNSEPMEVLENQLHENINENSTALSQALKQNLAEDITIPNIQSSSEVPADFSHSNNKSSLPVFDNFSSDQTEQVIDVDETNNQSSSSSTPSIIDRDILEEEPLLHDPADAFVNEFVPQSLNADLEEIQSPFSLTDNAVEPTQFASQAVSQTLDHKPFEEEQLVIEDDFQWGD